MWPWQPSPDPVTRPASGWREPTGAVGLPSRIEYVVLLLDRSASMRRHDYPPSRLKAACEAVCLFYDAKRGVDPRDRVATCQFDVGCDVVAGFGMPRAQVVERVRSIRAGRSTAIGSALETGRALLAREAPVGATRRLVLLSDGGANTGPDPRQVARACREHGILIDAVGIGRKDDYPQHEGLLRDLAAITGGRFVACDDVPGLIASYRRLAQKVAPPPPALAPGPPVIRSRPWTGR